MADEKIDSNEVVTPINVKKVMDFTSVLLSGCAQVGMSQMKYETLYKLIHEECAIMKFIEEMGAVTSIDTESQLTYLSLLT